MADLNAEIEQKEKRMQVQVSQLEARRREAAEASARKQQECDVKHHQLQKRLDAAARANEERLKDKAREAQQREASRRAAQAELIEMHRVADTRLVARKEEHGLVPITRRGDKELKHIARSLSEVQLTARERARKAAKIVDPEAYA